MKVQGMFKRWGHLASLIGIHVCVRQRCRAQDVESSALPAMSTRNVPAGQWNVTCVGSNRCKAHGGLPPYTPTVSITSGAMEEVSQKVQKTSTYLACSVRIHVGIGQCCRTPDVESSTLQANKAKCVTFHWVMDESSGKVQDANTPNQQQCCHRYCSLQS